MPDLVAIAVYREEDYAAVRALAPDGGGMDETFGQWKELADEHIERARARGLEVMLVEIHPEEFAAWLRANNLKSDNETRARFCHYLASRRMAD